MRSAGRGVALGALVGLALPALTASARVQEQAARPPAKHTIGVRVVGGSGELYDRRSGKRFIARGANYVRLAAEGHSTFNVGRYSGPRAGQALARMRALGFNAVRVFVEGNCALRCAGAPGGGISRAYARNLTDFLTRAKKAKQFVILTTQWLPEPYGSTIGDSALVDDVNRIFLTSGGIDAYARFWRDLVLELKRRRAPLDAVLAFDVMNEAAFVVNQAPFTLTSGTLRAPDGRRYDLADPAARERLLGEGLVPFVDRVRAAIRKADPTALVSASYFQPSTPNPTRAGDVRDLRSRAVIERSKADIVDIHAYPGFELSLAEYMQNFGVSGPTRKPIVMGEFGAFKEPYASPADAAPALQAWQAASCRYGIDGWLVWTWDTDEQTELWNAESQGSSIASALAPRRHPDPCRPPPGPTNLALGKPVTASSGQDSAPAAVDGNPGTNWSSEADPPQWVEIDLQRSETVGTVKLSVAQFPVEGHTIHRVWTKGPGAGDEYVLRQTLEGTTRDGETLDARAGGPWPGVRYVRIETTSSPSWVAWREIQVLDAG